MIKGLEYLSYTREAERPGAFQPGDGWGKLYPCVKYLMEGNREDGDR